MEKNCEGEELKKEEEEKVEAGITLTNNLFLGFSLFSSLIPSFPFSDHSSIALDVATI